MIDYRCNLNHGHRLWNSLLTLLLAIFDGLMNVVLDLFASLRISLELVQTRYLLSAARTHKVPLE